jgi:hypothetical protein
VIHPDLLYDLWKQEHGERLRTAAHRQTVRDAELTRLSERSRSEMVKPAPRQLDSPIWLRVVRLRRRWRIS